MALIRSGDYKGAKEAFEREVARAPDYHEFHFWLAIAAANLGESDSRRSTSSWRCATARRAATRTLRGQARPVQAPAVGAARRSADPDDLRRARPPSAPVDLAALIRTVPDFPRPGVQFRDITTLLKDAAGFRAVVDGFVEALPRPADRQGRGDRVARLHRRGAARGRLRVGFVPIRKRGKLPAENFGQDYELEYGADRLEMHRDAVAPGERVLVVDDLIATGGTAEAALKLIALAGGTVVGCAFVIDLPDLGGRAKLERRGVPTVALCAFAGP